MQIIPFESQSGLPAYLTQPSDGALDINKEVVRAALFPTMSIKGKVFTLSKDGKREVLQKPDEDGEMQPVASIGVVFLRANMKGKTFYKDGYDEASSAGAPPDCYSMDTITPSPHARFPQAKTCQACPRQVWGGRVNDQGEAKGRECSDNARIAISAPDQLNPTLIRVPPASLKPLREMLKLVSTRKVPYNAVIVKLGFDKESASPKLTFKPIGLVDDATYKAINEIYDGELVRSIVGLDDVGDPDHAHAALPKPATVDEQADELDAALAARAAAAPAPAPAPAPAAAPAAAKVTKPRKETPPPAPAPAPVPVQAAAPAPAPDPVQENAGNLLSDLDKLLAGGDDD